MFSRTARDRVDRAVLVTGNPDKVREAERICGFRLQHEPLELPEIQSSRLAEVAAEKAREACGRLGRTVIVEETGLELAALNGFPGPLVKWMLQAVGPQGIARTALALGNPVASAVCLLVLLDPESDDGHQVSTVGEGRTSGRLVLPPRGEHGFGWDPVFEPDGETLTYAELGDHRKDDIGHRGRAWRALAKRLGSA